MKWNFIDKTKPITNGVKLVCWAEPYHKEMSVGIGYWREDRFSKQYAGANEILFWKEITLPKCDRKIRTRRVENSCK